MITLYPVTQYIPYRTISYYLSIHIRITPIKANTPETITTAGTAITGAIKNNATAVQSNLIPIICFTYLSY